MLYYSPYFLTPQEKQLKRQGPTLEESTLRMRPLHV